MLPRYASFGPVPVSHAYRIRIRTRYAPDTALIRQLAYRPTWRIPILLIRSPIRVDSLGYASDTPRIRVWIEARKRPTPVNRAREPGSACTCEPRSWTAHTPALNVIFSAFCGDRTWDVAGASKIKINYHWDTALHVIETSNVYI